MGDFKQTTLFKKTAQERGIEREEAFLDGALPKLRETAKSRNANPDNVTYKVRNAYSSVYFRSSLICRLRLRGGQKRVELPKRLEDAIPEDMAAAVKETPDQFLRVPFEIFDETSILDLLCQAVLSAIELVPKEFDCCSRFEECCDTKVCVHPDPSFSMLCGYRKILKSGRIFSGKNRNID